MSVIDVSVVSAAPASDYASPAVVLRAHLTVDDDRRIHAAIVRCQVQIEPRSRRYTIDEQRRLYDLFGAPETWHRHLKAFVWGQASIALPAFDHSVDFDIPIPCTYDLNVAASKYFDGVRDGHVDIRVLLSGTLFRVEGGALDVEPIAWETEARYSMPVVTWDAAMQQFFPGAGWIRFGREAMDAFRAFRASQAFINPDDALMALIGRQQTTGVESGSR